MQSMHWSWAELQSTPMYVRQFCFDLENIKRTEQQRRREAGQ